VAQIKQRGRGLHLWHVAQDAITSEPEAKWHEKSLADLAIYKQLIKELLVQAGRCWAVDRTSC